MSVSKPLGAILSDNLGLLLTLVVVAILCVPTFFTFQLNYGWWQAWSYMEDNGLELYEDVNIVFPPLFLKLTQLISNISDTRLFSMVLGVVRVIALQCAFYFFLRMFFDKLPATIGAFIVTAEQIRLTTFIPDDYHVTERLLFIVSVIFFYKLIEKTKSHSPNSYLYGALCASSMTLLFYTKQNIGLGVILATVLGYSLFAGIHFKRWASAITFFLMNVAAVIVIGGMLGVSATALDSTLLSNDAKGNFFTLSSNIIMVPQNRRYIMLAAPIAAFWLFIIYRYDVVKSFIEDMRKYYALIPNILKSDILIWSPPLAALFVFVLLFFYSDKFIPIALAIGAVGIVWSIKKKPPTFAFLAFPFMGMLYASSMTSALVFDSSVMLGIILVCWLLQTSMKVKKSSAISHLLIWLFFGLYSTQLLAHKINVPYSWWGLTSPPVNFSTTTFNVPQLKSTRMDALTADVLRTIQASIEKYSKKRDDVYLYPHIPYLYKIFEKLPPTKNAVQWFDVVTSEALSDEVDNLTKKKPNLLIFFDPPQGTYQGHANFKRITENQQTKILNWTNDMVSQGQYELVEYIIFDNKKINETGRIDVRLKNLHSVNETQIEKFSSKLEFSYRIEHGPKNENKLAKFEVTKLAKFEVTKLAELELLVKLLGGLYKEDEHWYSLKIYRRVK